MTLDDVTDEIDDEPDDPDAANNDDAGDLPPAAVWVVTNWRSILLAAVLAFLGLGVGIFAATPKLPATDSVDAGFLQDMMYHHDQAVRMSLYVVGHSDDIGVNGFAQEIVIDQRWDMGRMAQLMEEWKLPEADPNRMAMEWMGMGMAVNQMPGIQPEDKVKALGTLRGPELNRQFLTMMRDHHKGGIEMADYEAEHGSDPILREVAATMARNQRGEVLDYNIALKRLGFE